MNSELKAQQRCENDKYTLVPIVSSVTVLQQLLNKRKESQFTVPQSRATVSAISPVSTHTQISC